jgi:hypothetical protein
MLFSILAYAVIATVFGLAVLGAMASTGLHSRLAT